MIPDPKDPSPPGWKKALLVPNHQDGKGEHGVRVLDIILVQMHNMQTSK